MYKILLKLALENLNRENTISRVMTSQSRQVRHFQTFKMSPENFIKFRQKEDSVQTEYAIDFVVKYRPENMHDQGHYLFIMFQGEKIYERKRKTLLDYRFYLVRREFEAAYNAINKHYSDGKRNLLFEKIGG